jgi:hypothetical protein
MNCKKNVCGDGALLPGTEQCDDGSVNGRLCKPKYGLTCNYCKTDCSVETVSGAYCGDTGTGKPPKTILDAPPESCDPGAVTSWCSRTYTKLSTPIADPNDLSAPSDVIRGCHGDTDCLPGVCRNFVGETTGSKPCHSSSDCGNGTGGTAFQFCQGGEGQCLSYNLECQPQQYSNTVAAPDSPQFLDGSCNTCTSSCVGTRLKSPFFCGDEILQKQYGETCEGKSDPNATTVKGTYYQCIACKGLGQCGDHVVQSQFGESCEAPGAGTSSNDQYQCSVGCKWQGGWCGDNLLQVNKGELCDQDNRCITAKSPDPALHTQVDMIFAVDISTSMQSYINNISAAIKRFVELYRGTPHQFGLVAFGQGNSSPLETKGSNGRVVVPLTDVKSFQEKFSQLGANGGGVEPMYQSVYELASSADTYGIGWRPTAIPYIVAVTDEPPPCGWKNDSCNFPVDDRWVTENEVANKVSHCEIGGCAGKAGYHVETFVMTFASAKNANATSDNLAKWDSIIYGDLTNRFIELKPDQPDPVSYYFDKLRTTTFQNVCKNPAPL